MRQMYLYVILAGLLIISCAGSEKNIESLTVVYSGNIGGMVEPCGCNPPLGGYPRRATLVSALREQFNNLIILDSGGMLFGTNKLTPRNDFTKRLDAYVALQAMDIIGTDAINVSGFDLANTPDSLLAYGAEMSFSWLSANVVWRDTGEPVFTTDYIIERGNLKIGVFGLMSGNFSGSPLFTANSTITTTDYIEAAAHEVEKLKKECDVIIALAYMSEKEVQALAEKQSDISIIVHSHNNVHTPSSDHVHYAPYQVNDTIIVRSPEGGRVVGVMELSVVGGDRSLVELTSDQVSQGDAETFRKILQKQGSSYLNTFIDLGAEIRDDETIQALIDKVEPIKAAYQDSVYREN